MSLLLLCGGGAGWLCAWVLAERWLGCSGPIVAAPVAAGAVAMWAVVYAMVDAWHGAGLPAYLAIAGAVGFVAGGLLKCVGDTLR